MSAVIEIAQLHADRLSGDLDRPVRTLSKVGDRVRRPGIPVLGYLLLQALAKQSDDLDWLNALSPYAWVYHQPPLQDGVYVGRLALTWGLAALCAAASALVLHRRDITG